MGGENPAHRTVPVRTEKSLAPRCVVLHDERIGDTQCPRVRERTCHQVNVLDARQIVLLTTRLRQIWLFPTVGKLRWFGSATTAAVHATATRC